MEEEGPSGTAAAGSDAFRIRPPPPIRQSREPQPQLQQASTHAHGSFPPAPLPYGAFPNERWGSPESSNASPERPLPPLHAYPMHALTTLVHDGLPLGFDSEAKSVAGSSRAMHHASTAPVDLRAFTRSDVMRPGLESGDVVMMLHNGQPYVATAAPQQEGTPVHFTLELCRDVAFGAAVAESSGAGATAGAASQQQQQQQQQQQLAGAEVDGEEWQGRSYLEIIRQGPYIGLRCSAAGNRFLQPRRKAPHALVFFSDRLGVWEQWEVGGEEWRAAWKTLAIRLRSRRLPQVELSVELRRVGQYAVVPSVGGHVSTGLPTPRSTMSVVSELGTSQYGESAASLTEDKQLKRLSGLFMHEWFRFVEHERHQRLAVEREMAGLVSEMADLKMDTIAQVELLRCDMAAEMAALADALRLYEQQLATSRLARRRAIEAAVFAAWRRTRRGVLRDVYCEWRQYAALRAARRAAAARAERWARGRACREVLSRWMQRVRDRESKMHGVARAVGLSYRRLCGKVLEAWKGWVAVKRGRRGKEGRAEERGRRCVGRRALTAWRAAVRAGRERVEQAEQRAREAVAARALAAWRAGVEAGAAERDAENRVAAWAGRRAKRAVLWTLLAAAEHARQAAAGAEALRAARAARTCRAVLRAWQDVCLLHHHARTLLGRMALRHDRALLAHAWAGWCERLRASQLLHHLVAGWQGKREEGRGRAVLQAWKEAVVEGRRIREVEGRCGKRRKDRLVARAWFWWAAWAGRQRVLRRGVEAMARRLGAGLLATAFQGWEEVALGRCERGRHVERVLARRRALVWLLAWREAAVAMLGAREGLTQRLQACVRRWGLRAAAAAFARWRDMAALRTERVERAVGGLSPCSRLALAALLGAWWSDLRLPCSSGPDAGLGLGSSGFQQERVAEAGLVLPVGGPGEGLHRGHTEVAKASWDVTYDVRQRREGHGEAGPRGRGLGAEADGWEEEASRWHWLLAVCFGSWRRGAAGRAERVAAALRLEDRALGRVLSSVLEAWQRQARVQGYARLAVSRARRKSGERLLAHAFEEWAAQAQRWAAGARAADAAAAARRRRVLGDVLGAWWDWARATKVQRLTVGRFEGRLARRRLLVWLRAWRAVVVAQAEALERLRVCVKRKKVAFAHFKEWYWNWFDADVQDTIRRVFHTTETYPGYAERYPPDTLMHASPAPSWASPPVHSNGHSSSHGRAPAGEVFDYDPGPSQDPYSYRAPGPAAYYYPRISPQANGTPFSHGGVGAMPPAASFSAWAFAGEQDAMRGGTHGERPAGTSAAFSGEAGLPPSARLAGRQGEAAWERVALANNALFDDLEQSPGRPSEASAWELELETRLSRGF